MTLATADTCLKSRLSLSYTLLQSGKNTNRRKSGLNVVYKKRACRLGALQKGECLHACVALYCRHYWLKVLLAVLPSVRRNMAYKHAARPCSRTS